MTASQPAAHRSPGSHTVRGALVIGLPLAVGVLVLLHLEALQGTLAQRYVSHPVEWAEVVLFCCALGALAAKFLQARFDRRACGVQVIPAWDGRPVPVDEAGGLGQELERLPRGLHGTWLVHRVRAVLDFVRARGSANELDDQMRSLADADAQAVEDSYALLRFICWAIPILGFLGTVLGITEAVAGVTPQKLEESLSTVTDGLALAFDTTALALALTMILMFLMFLQERAEAGVLEQVDGYVERQLAHRFLRETGAAVGLASGLRHDTQAILQASERLVERQVELWGRTMQEMHQRHAQAEQQQQERLTAALEEAWARTLQTHARQLAALEEQAVQRSAGLLLEMNTVAEAVCQAGREQQQALTQVAEEIAAQADVLGRLQDGDRQLMRVQELLNQNLAAVAAAGTFEQAVHSLTAAVHLLTAYSVQGPGRPRRLGAEPQEGKAA